MSTRTKSLFSMAYATAESKMTYMGYSRELGQEEDEVEGGFDGTISQLKLCSNLPNLPHG